MRIRKSAAALLAALLAVTTATAEEGSAALLGVQVKVTPTVQPAATPAPTGEVPAADLTEALMADITQEEIAAAGLGERILMRGMEGEDVRLLQRRLYQLGYYLGSIDGVFGLGTRTAVYGFQRAHKLEKIDGKIGPESISRMFSDDVVVKPTPTPTPTVTPTPSPTPTATPKPTPAPSATPRAEGAPFELTGTFVYVDGVRRDMVLGRDEQGELLYPLCGVMGWLGYSSRYDSGSWQLTRAEDGAEIALMTDGQDGLSPQAMGAYQGVVFLADEKARVYVYGEEAYVTAELLGLLGTGVLIVEGVPVIGE